MRKLGAAHPPSPRTGLDVNIVETCAPHSDDGDAKVLEARENLRAEVVVD